MFSPTISARGSLLGVEEQEKRNIIDKERINKENQLKLVSKKEEEIKLEEDEDKLKIKCEPDIGVNTGRYYKCY